MRIESGTEIERTSRWIKRAYSGKSARVKGMYTGRGEQPLVNSRLELNLREILSQILVVKVSVGSTCGGNCAVPALFTLQRPIHQHE
jgi:hypothetical protein